MRITIDGSKICSEMDFHEQFAKSLGIQRYYGANLDALWDTVYRNVERPMCLVWENADVSRSNLGARFDQIVEVLRDAEKDDLERGYSDKFELILKFSNREIG